MRIHEYESSANVYSDAHQSKRSTTPTRENPAATLVVCICKKIVVPGAASCKSREKFAGRKKHCIFAFCILFFAYVAF